MALEPADWLRVARVRNTRVTIPAGAALVPLLQPDPQRVYLKITCQSGFANNSWSVNLTAVDPSRSINTTITMPAGGAMSTTATPQLVYAATFGQSGLATIAGKLTTPASTVTGTIAHQDTPIDGDLVVAEDIFVSTGTGFVVCNGVSWTSTAVATGVGSNNTYQYLPGQQFITTEAATVNTVSGTLDSTLTITGTTDTLTMSVPASTTTAAETFGGLAAFIDYIIPAFTSTTGGVAGSVVSTETGTLGGATIPITGTISATPFANLVAVCVGMLQSNIANTSALVWLDLTSPSNDLELSWPQHGPLVPQQFFAISQGGSLGGFLHITELIIEGDPCKMRVPVDPWPEYTKARMTALNLDKILRAVFPDMDVEENGKLQESY